MTMTPLQWDKSRALKRKKPRMKNDEKAKPGHAMEANGRWKDATAADDAASCTTMPRIQLKRQEATIRLAHDSHFFSFL